MATLKDIARHVSLSVSAVSLALRDHPSISEDTKKRVREAKKKLGYQVKSKTNGSIAFVLLDRGFDTFIYARAFQSIGEKATECDLQPIYLSLSHDAVMRGEFPLVLQNRKVDGMIVSGAYDERVHEQLKGLGIPIVVLGNYQLGFEPWASCEVDLFEGMRMLIHKLAGLGHRRIGLLTCTPDQREFGHQIRQHFMNAVAEFGLQATGEACEHDYEEAGESTRLQQATARLLAGNPAPTAIVAERANVEVFEQCSREGIHVPNDLSLVSLGAINYQTRPSLATLESDPAEMGRGAFEKLQRMIEKPGCATTREFFPMRLLLGDSLGPARAA